MPEICRPCANQHVRLCMYADDHPPPHFHLRGPDFDAMIDLVTLEIMRGWVPPRELKEARDYARANETLLREKWNELNERD